MPEGSPEAMRKKAAELKADAQRLRDKFDGLPALADSVEFLADAGTRWRREVKQCARNALTYAGQADDLAGQLIKEAHRLEELQQAWKVLKRNPDVPPLLPIGEFGA